jgi:hypothetical protein
MRIASVLFVALLFVISGCGKSEASYAGRYSGKATIDDEMRGIMRDAAGANADMVIQALEATTYDLELKEDKTFTVKIMLMGEVETHSGTWKYENGQIALTGGGSRMSPTLTPSADGKSLAGLDANTGKGIYTFTEVG